MTVNRNIAILFFTLVVVMLGFGMVIPILPFYIKSFGASGSALGALMASYAVMQFIFAPIWGSLSDRYGRKPVILIGVLGNGLAQLFFGLSSQLWMLFAARILAGVLSSATLPTAMAYIGDSTTEEDRGGGMGVLGAAMGVGMVLGPGIAGSLASRSLATPFFVAAALSALALLLILITLPESLPGHKRQLKSVHIQGPQLQEMWRVLFSSPIGLLLFMAFLLSFGLTNFEAVFGLYALERYGYGTREVGWLLTFIGVVSTLVQGAFTGPLSRRWGEAKVIKFALIGCALGYIFMLGASNLFTLILTTGFFITGNALLRPLVSSLTSRRATVGQGIAMGMNNAFMSLGRSVGPLWAGLIFDINMQFPYISGALIMLIGFIISILWLSNATQVEPDTQLAGQPH